MNICLPGDFIQSYSQEDKKFIIKEGDFNSTTVLGKIENGNFYVLKKAIVPQLNDIIIGKVIRSRRKEAHLIILKTQDQPLLSPLLAELRSVDIQEKDVDNVIASDFCKPGDLIKGKIVALGRSGFYAQITTVGEDLGVLKLEKN